MSRNKIIEIATSQIGTGETPPNSNKTPYGQWYGWDGYAWCAMFVSWVYDKAGYPLGKIDDPKGYRACQSGYNHWKAKGELTSKPQAGDIVLFDWKGKGHCDHTGIFKEWVKEGQTFRAIEGNTAVGNDRDGGMVMERIRTLQNVRAFASPGVLGRPKQQQQPIMQAWQKGNKGSEVADIQKQFYDLGYTIVVDGDYGNQTVSIVKQFQKENGLPVDGIVTQALRGLIADRLQQKEAADSKLTTGAYLKKGAAGAAVVALQKAINKKVGKKTVEEDGVFGDQTVAAVKAFQKKYGLVADGIAGPQTLAALGFKNI